MIDLLVYCSNTEIFVNKVREHYPDKLNEDIPDNPMFLVDKTPIKRNGKNTLSLVRCRPDGVTEAMLRDLASKTTTIKMLGTWEEVQADPKAKALYDEVYPRTPVTWVDNDGEEHESIPPEQIGVFA